MQVLTSIFRPLPLVSLTLSSLVLPTSSARPTPLVQLLIFASTATKASLPKSFLEVLPVQMVAMLKSKQSNYPAGKMIVLEDVSEW